MRIDYAFICKHAEHTDNGQAIDACGIGIQNYTFVPYVPFEFLCYVVALIRAEASEAGMHTMSFAFSDSRGNETFYPDKQIEAKLSPHDRHSYMSTVNDVGLPIQIAGRHKIRIIVDGKEIHRLELHIGLKA